MKSDYEKKDRAGELIRQILADTLQKQDDSDLEFVSIISVDVDNQLNRAKITISTLGGSDERVLLKLEKKKSVFRKALSRKTRFKQLPQLIFQTDDSQITKEHEDHIEEILKEIEAETDD